jgi:hypothetical protein
MSRDSFNTCIRRSYSGEFKKIWGDQIYDDLRHAFKHQPFIFINDQEPEKSIIYANNFVIFDD